MVAKMSKLDTSKIRPTAQIPTVTIDSPSSAWYAKQGDEIIKEVRRNSREAAEAQTEVAQYVCTPG